MFHHENEFIRGKSHINGIESFCNFAERRSAKFNGLADEKFILHLKECESRFNLRNENVTLFMEQLYFKNKKVITRALILIANNTQIVNQ